MTSLAPSPCNQSEHNLFDGGVGGTPGAGGFSWKWASWRTKQCNTEACQEKAAPSQCARPFFHASDAARNSQEDDEYIEMAPDHSHFMAHRLPVPTQNHGVFLAHKSRLASFDRKGSSQENKIGICTRPCRKALCSSWVAFCRDAVPWRLTHRPLLPRPASRSTEHWLKTAQQLRNGTRPPCL